MYYILAYRMEAMSDVDGEPTAKRVKTDTANKSNKTCKLLSFSDFKVDRVLCMKPETKLMTLLGKFSGSDEDGILVVEKQPITEESVRGLLSCDAKVNSHFHNDIYSQYVVDVQCGLGEVRVMGIYPATEKHIIKYSSQRLHMVNETPKLYRSVTRPFIERQAFTLEWVYNILDGKAEMDRVIFSDPDPERGFLLLPDMKWDCSDVQNLYLLALVRRRDILSLRELNQDHLPLLKNILTKGKEAIFKEFGICGDEVRVYLHYQPSYYHLHVHFTHINYTAPKTLVGEAHLLQEVIDNIQLANDYYQKKTISFCVKESSPLWREFAESNAPRDSYSQLSVQ